ncbi:MAG: type ISP restriction/modification enzyme, partial [Pirellulales bacterium]
DVVDWATVSKGSPEAWLYFYEDFLEVYDNDLRKLTGSYYTPPEVVGAMVRLVDETLRSPEAFGLPAGLASPQVTIADPAIGTGTFLLGVLRGISESVQADQGEGAVAEAINAAIDRVIGFEMQLGPFAVAQLRVLAELADLLGEAPTKPPRLYVTDTLGDPFAEIEWLPGMLKPIGESRREANVVKRSAPITVVIGNPPYKEKAKGRGGWVEKGHGESRAILDDWQPPREWKVGTHAKHLRNLYVYFWRWATWKVFDAHPEANTGVVAFITVAGFLNGAGFEKMRDYLRRTANRIWVIDCSPEGHQPDVPTRIFQGVQHPVCIVIAARSAVTDGNTPGVVQFASLPEGRREEKFVALARLTINGPEWRECPTDWRAPFLPGASGAWASFIPLESVFQYNGSGVMPGRTWIIAPDSESLAGRWKALVSAKDENKETLFHPHLVSGKPGDRHVHRIVEKGLPGFPDRKKAVADEGKACPDVISYGFRSFDRQWIIADNRVINRPNPTLWEQRSNRQVYLTAPTDQSPTAGPSITFSSEVCDLHHYNGRGGRVFPLWSDNSGNKSNVAPKLLACWSETLGHTVDAPDVISYLAAVAAHPAYVQMFAEELRQPGLRIPITADAATFAEAVTLGREIVWLHTFGERFTDPKAGRSKSPPRMTKATSPRIPEGGAIPSDPERMPDNIEYDATQQRLIVGEGYIEPVTPEVWAYEVSGKQVLRQWFSYRKRNRERPLIGDRRPPSPLGDIQPDHWLAEYTTELLNVLHVLGRLVVLQPVQAELMQRICAGPLLTDDELRKAGLYNKPEPSIKPTGKKRKDGEGQRRFA